MTQLLLVLAVLPFSQTAPDPGYLQGAVASAERLEVIFWETDPPTRVVIQDAKIIEQLAQVMNLCLPGVSAVQVPQSGHVFHIRVVPKGQGKPVHEFTLCQRHVVFYGAEKRYHAQLASTRFHSGFTAPRRITHGGHHQPRREESLRHHAWGLPYFLSSK